MSDLIKTLQALVASPGRDHRTGIEFVHGHDSQTVVDAIRWATAEIERLRTGIKRLSDEEELCAETTGDDPFSLVYLAAKLSKAEANRDKALANVSFAQSYGWRHALYAAATTAHGLIAMDYVADHVRDSILSLMNTSPWRPIAEADIAITRVQDFPEAGITLRNSDRYWVRDEDGRIYEASWTEDKAGYWWDWEGESPVDPVEFMPHPLDPRWSDTRETLGAAE